MKNLVVLYLYIIMADFRIFYGNVNNELLLWQIVNISDSTYLLIYLTTLYSKRTAL